VKLKFLDLVISFGIRDSRPSIDSTGFSYHSWGNLSSVQLALDGRRAIERHNSSVLHFSPVE
jgi:hypothetical protein